MSIESVSSSRKPRRRHFSRESRALLSGSGGASRRVECIMEQRRAGGTDFYGKTTLTRTLDLQVGDIARRRRRQSVRFEATFTGLHEGSASLSVLAGITFHVLRVPNRRYPGPHLHGGEERSWPSERSRYDLPPPSKKEFQNAHRMQGMDTM